MLVDFSAGFIDIMSRLAERVTNRVVFPFASDNDSFTRLIRTYRAFSARCRFRCGGTCLRKSQRRDERASESHNCLLHDDASLFCCWCLFMLRGSRI